MPAGQLVALLSAFGVLMMPVQAMDMGTFSNAHPPLIKSRLDPIQSKGKIASHVHLVVGSSGFDHNADYDQLRDGSCTTAYALNDASAYWTPHIYYRWANDSVSLISPQNGMAVYWNTYKAEDEEMNDFPAGFRMITGDANRGNYDPSNPEHRGIYFRCLGDNVDMSELPSREKICDAVQAMLTFPSCWDCKSTDTSDHKSHMAFEVNGRCPATHPCRVPTLGLEQRVQVSDFPWQTEGSLVLSNGDGVGYSMHGDFFNGWNLPSGSKHSDLVQAPIDCPGRPGDASCGTLQQQGPHHCLPNRYIVDEPIGAQYAIPKLPGNNPFWGGSNPKAPDPNYVENAKIVPIGSSSYRSEGVGPGNAGVPQPATDLSSSGDRIGAVEEEPEPASAAPASTKIVEIADTAPAQFAATTLGGMQAMVTSGTLSPQTVHVTVTETYCPNATLATKMRKLRL